MTHVAGVDTEKRYTKLNNFGMCNGTPFSDFSREFCALLSIAAGSERVLFPGTDMMSEVVRVTMNEQ